MNPQFCPTFRPIPRFVPVVARPTAPAGFSNFPLSSPCHIPAFPAPLSPDVPFTQATSKTRKDLEQLGSPIVDKSLSEVIFELAAQKNGIRIGTVSNKAKQGNSLEDFKKIAERNGITVNPAGSNLKMESEKAEKHSKETVSAVNGEISSDDDETVNKEEGVCEVKNIAESFEAEVVKGMHSKSPVAYVSMDEAEMSGVKVENSTSIVKGSAGIQVDDFEQLMAVDNPCHVINAKSSKCSSTNEHVSNATKSVTQDKQICGQSRITMGRFSNGTNDSINKAEGEVEVLDFIEQDHQVARFQEMARLNGIKVGENAVCDTREVSRDSVTEYTDSGCGMNLQQSNCYHAVDIDPKIAKFQELAWLNGIKVGIKSLRTPSISSVSSCDSSDDQSNPQVVEKWPTTNSPHCIDSFLEAAERNGIKVSKRNFSEETPLNFMNKCINNNCSLATPSANVSVEASSQTDLAATVDCQCQTQDSYNEISGKSEGLQDGIAVSVTKEALEEEYLLWKFDDNVSSTTKLCYKDLYFHERRNREQLTASLHERGGTTSTKGNDKATTDELREELNLKSKECEGLKTEMKTAKKHKDAEINQITKELKLRQEELEKTRTNLQLKEVAVEALRQIVQEQTAKIKDLEKELEDAQHALFQVLENEDWKTCQRQTTDNSKGFATTGKKMQSDDDDDKDGWTLFLGKRQKNPSKRQTKTNNAQSGSVSQLCEIDCSDSPSVDKQFSDQTTSSDAGIQSSCAGCISFDCVSQTSSEDGYVGCGESSLVGEADGLRGDQQNGPGNWGNVTAGTGNFPPSPQTHQQSAFCTVSSNADAQQVAEGLSAQQASHSIHPSTLLTQPYPLPAVSPDLLSQYLSNQPQNLQTSENIPQLSHFSGSVRHPPGLNTEPVPEGQVPKQQKLRPSWSTGKFSSFDKLMVALQERFPSKNRQELIAVLKKAKAHSGAAGFKGMQIPDVVKCVEDIVETEETQKS